MRKTIAERLLFSKQNIPHFYLTLDCLVDKLLALKDEMNDLVKERFKLTINDFIIKALACAMRDFPDVNASWQEDKINLYDSIGHSSSSSNTQWFSHTDRTKCLIIKAWERYHRTLKS